MTQNLKSEHSQEEKYGNLKRELNNRFIGENHFFIIIILSCVVKLHSFYTFSTGGNNVYFKQSKTLSYLFTIFIAIGISFANLKKKEHAFTSTLIWTTYVFSHYGFYFNYSNLSHKYISYAMSFLKSQYERNHIFKV